MTRSIIFIASIFFVAIGSAFWSNVALDYRTSFQQALETGNIDSIKEVAAIWIVNTPHSNKIETTREIAEAFYQLNTGLNYIDRLLVKAIRRFDRHPDQYNHFGYYGEDWVCYKDELMTDLLELRLDINTRLGAEDTVKDIRFQLFSHTVN